MQTCLVRDGREGGGVWRWVGGLRGRRRRILGGRVAVGGGGASGAGNIKEDER